jgi:hypothetical protein
MVVEEEEEEEKEGVLIIFRLPCEFFFDYPED